MKKTVSFFDESGKLYVDCAECIRGGNGADDDKCAFGVEIKLTRKGGCYAGYLSPGLKAWSKRPVIAKSRPTREISSFYKSPLSNVVINNLSLMLSDFGCPGKQLVFCAIFEVCDKSKAIRSSCWVCQATFLAVESEMEQLKYSLRQTICPEVAKTND